jgi:hypothetical protein
LPTISIGLTKIFSRRAASSHFGIQKARFDAAGYIKAGPALPPYHVTPPRILKSARECGLRRKKLREKYADTSLRLVSSRD